jgi:O-antigen ligase
MNATAEQPGPQRGAGRRPAPRLLLRTAFAIFVVSLLFEMVKLPLPSKVTSLCGAVFILTTASQPRLCYRRPPTAWLFFLGWACICLTLAVWIGPSAYTGDVIHETVVLFQSLLLFWVSYSLMVDVRTAEEALGALALGCVALALLQVAGITATVVDAGTEQARVSAAGQNPSDVAMMGSMGFVWLTNVLLNGRPRGLASRLVLLAAAGAIGLMILRTEARGAMLALAAALLVYLIQPGGLGVRCRNLVVLILAVAAFLFAGLRSPSLMARVHEAQSGDLAGRQNIYPLAIGMVRERPVLGWGFVTNTVELGARVQHPGLPRRDPHDLYLFILTATGFLGGLPAFIALWLCWRDAWRARTGPHGVAAFSLMTLVLVGNLSVTWYSKAFWIVLGYACASAVVARRREGSVS